MAQLDKELFIEYIFWIFLTITHFYTSFFINKTILQINVRNFFLKYSYLQIRSRNEQQKILQFIIENSNKIK